MKLILVCLLACASYAQTIDAPQPKREALKFTAASVFFAGSSLAQIITQHDGAKECIAEDNRAGVGSRFGTAPAFGMHPPDARELTISGSILSTAIVLEIAHHRTAAKRILIYAGLVKYGIAGATQWMGCN